MKLHGLYPIIDADSLLKAELDVIEFCKSVLACRPSLIQLRAKHAAPRQVLAWLREMRQLCRQTSTLLFANDRADLALLAECDGVHVGQDDLSVAEVRRSAPALRIGVSTHDARQLESALGERPFYVAYGPVYATASKEHPDPTVGLEGLMSAANAAEQAGIPIVAIGGITLERASSIRAAGAAGAVIQALVPRAGRAEVPDLARALHRALGGFS